MKFTTILAAIVAAQLFTGTADAAKTKASFVCTLTDVQIVEAPALDDLEIIVAVRLTCSNKGVKPVRIKVADVFLLNSNEGKYQPDQSPDNLDIIYEDSDSDPEYVDHFVDIAKGETKVLGFTFTGGEDLADPHLALDVDGVKYEYRHVTE
jgi:hypothetical protein